MRIRLPVAIVALFAAGMLAAQEPAAPATTAGDAPAATAAPAAEPAAAQPVADTADYSAAKPGDAAAGEAKAAVCGACHGLDGNSADPLNPKLAGQNERYIARQLKLFKSGQRQSPVMQPLAAALSPQDMRDLGAFFATKSIMPGTGDEAFKDAGQGLFRGGSLEAGVPACMACHGPAGRGNPGAAYPSIGGQHADYTKARLLAFREGLVLGSGDDANSVMAAVSANLSDDDIEALASYVEGLHHVTAGVAAEPGAQSVAAQPAAAAGEPGTVTPNAAPNVAPEKVPDAPAATPTPSG